MIYNDERPERIRGAIYLTALVLSVGYMTINMFVPNADMIVATRILAGAVYATVLYVYGRDAWIALTKPEPKRTDFLIVGIVLSFGSQLLQTIYAVIYRLAQAPTWLLNAEIVSPIVLLSVVAAVLHICAPGAVDGTVPRRNRIALGVGVGFAFLAVGAIVSTRPDIRPMIDLTRPYIGDWWRTGAMSGGASPS